MLRHFQLVNIKAGNLMYANRLRTIEMQNNGENVLIETVNLTHDNKLKWQK